MSTFDVTDTHLVWIAHNRYPNDLGQESNETHIVALSLSSGTQMTVHASRKHSTRHLVAHGRTAVWSTAIHTSSGGLFRADLR